MPIGGLIRGIRGGSKAADDVAQGADDTPSVSFEDDSYSRRLAAYTAGETANQFSRSVDAGTSSLAQTAKYGAAGAVGTSGVYFGSQAAGDYSASQSEQARQSTAQDFSDAAEQIMGDDALTPEQKQDALQRLNEMADQALDVGDAGGLLSGVFGDLGMIEKVFLGLVVLALIRAALKKRGDL